jgi:small GTP-binding protein
MGGNNTININIYSYLNKTMLDFLYLFIKQTSNKNRKINNIYDDMVLSFYILNYLDKKFIFTLNLNYSHIKIIKPSNINLILIKPEDIENNYYNYINKKLNKEHKVIVLFDTISKLNYDKCKFYNTVKHIRIIPKSPDNTSIISLIKYIIKNVKRNENKILEHKKIILKKEPIKKIFKILMLGDTGTGKSQICNRLVNNKFVEDGSCTIGVDFFRININNSILQIWDTQCQERVRRITRTYLKYAHLSILVYDITQKRSLQGIKIWIKEILNYSGYIPPILICANKIDVINRRYRNIR